MSGKAPAKKSRDLAELLKLLRGHGVSYFREGELVVQFADGSKRQDVGLIDPPAPLPPDPSGPPFEGVKTSTVEKWRSEIDKATRQMADMTPEPEPTDEEMLFWSAPPVEGTDVLSGEPGDKK